MAQVLVVKRLHLVGQCDLFVGELIGTNVVLPNNLPPLGLAGIRMMTSMGTNPFLDLVIILLDGLNAFVVGAILVGDLVLHKANLLGEILGTMYPVVEDIDGVLGLGGGRHLLDEVYREIVSRHRC